MKPLFLATAEWALLYGSKTWSIDKKLCKKLDECYTRILRMAMNMSWKQKLRNQQLYGTLPTVSSKVTYRRMKLAGPCIQHPE